VLRVVYPHGLRVGFRLFRFRLRLPDRGAQRYKGRQSGQKAAAKYPVQEYARVHDHFFMIV